MVLSYCGRGSHRLQISGSVWLWNLTRAWRWSHDVEPGLPHIPITLPHRAVLENSPLWAGPYPSTISGPYHNFSASKRRHFYSFFLSFFCSLVWGEGGLSQNLFERTHFKEFITNLRGSFSYKDSFTCLGIVGGVQLKESNIN